ncbi:hypothetical protein AAIB41_03530 [Brucella sp. BE17]|uniref:hypothetical protein n=1 Tax=Brucella sp. BE17 TaxID=3142977 RepID=UPI0031BAE18A
MKRRTFLRMIGLAPVAAALPSMALPKPENPTKIELNPEVTNPLIFRDGKLFFNPANIGQINVGTLGCGKTEIESMSDGSAVMGVFS